MLVNEYGLQKIQRHYQQFQLPKAGDNEPISEDAINIAVENTFKARYILGLDISEADKESVRKEFLSNNKILLGLGAVLVQKRHSKWFAQRKDTLLPMKYLERFLERYLPSGPRDAHECSWNSMDIVSDEIVNLLGDPDERRRVRAETRPNYR